MRIIGITGSIASGKTFICSYLKENNYKVFEADEEVKSILAENSIKQQLKECFSDCFEGEILDKEKIASIVFNNIQKLKILESIIHPEVVKARDSFLKKNEGENFVFLEAPLLYEIGYDLICDKVILVYTDEETRKLRALARQNMTEEKLRSILENQISDNDKKLKSDYLIYSTNDKETLIQMNEILNKVKNA